MFKLITKTLLKIGHSQTLNIMIVTTTQLKLKHLLVRLITIQMLI